MNSHNQAFQYWPALSRTSMPLNETVLSESLPWAEPITLVHFDSHNDMMGLDKDNCLLGLDNCWEALLRQAKSTWGKPVQARQIRKDWHRKASKRVVISDF